MTDIISPSIVCPWCQNSPTKVENANIMYTCWCHGKERAALQAHIYYDKINKFHLNMKDSPFFVFMTDVVNQSFWGIEERSNIPGAKVICICDGSIGLLEAAEKLKKYNKLKAFV